MTVPYDLDRSDPASLTAPQVAAPHRLVLVAARGDVLDAVRRVLAAADLGCVEADDRLVLARWTDAHAVILGSDRAAALASRVPRRAAAFVVADGEPDVHAWKAAAVLGAAGVFALPAEDAALVAALSAISTAAAADDADVVTVLGGCGGAGASVFAATLALAGANERRVLLADADDGGCGLDTLLGIEDAPGLRWPGLRLETGRVAPDSLRAAVPSAGAVAVLACADGRGPSPAALRAVVEASCDAGDLVVIDAPRGVGDLQDTALDLADLVVIVVPATVRSVIAARPVISRVRARTSHVGAVVRGPSPGGLAAADVERSIGVPLLATMRAERGLDAVLERQGLRLGRRSALGAAADDVLDVLGAGVR
ncbi:septum site-determining protein Ssd [Rhodococcus rhodnii]|uniref:Rv3660c-like CheY-like N-terminal domain-containing protein n=2 Tax=Rhodococcus rhodnii TaxID=38312 RepID=R7WI15_9NOCA|nr:septum site-determining protein Ssd [Rhodococcus rhodnii]EOM74803.1 hypothetical protein Rrhod_3884 [Rhodococcus rhodnii LMG 5362]